MSDNKLIYIIRNTPSLCKLWNKLNNEQKRRALFLAEGETFMIDLILEDMVEENV